MLGLDPSISGRMRLCLVPLVLRFSGLRFAPPENDGKLPPSVSRTNPL
jgi:hypothetical protein